MSWSILRIRMAVVPCRIWRSTTNLLDTQRENHLLVDLRQFVSVIGFAFLQHQSTSQHVTHHFLCVPLGYIFEFSLQGDADLAMWEFTRNLAPLYFIRIKHSCDRLLRLEHFEDHSIHRQLRHGITAVEAAEDAVELNAADAELANLKCLEGHVLTQYASLNRTPCDLAWRTCSWRSDPQKSCQCLKL